MLIVCPACASEYEISADRVGGNGRAVRCAACRETWFIAADPAMLSEISDGGTAMDAPRNGSATEADSEESASFPDILAAEADGRTAAFDRPAPYPRRVSPSAEVARRAGKLIPSPALAAGLAVFAIVPLALLGRATVVRAMPQTAGLFAGMGLPVNLRGVAFRDVVAFQAPAEGKKPAELVVEGDLIGVARARTEVPDIAIEVRDARDQPLYRWTIPSPRAAIENAAIARFRASLAAPPSQGRAVQVRFAQDASADDTRSAAKPGAAGHSEPKPAETPTATSDAATFDSTEPGSALRHGH